ncbi:MAG: dicarboxylate/amino acid:cation symporter [Holosporaceae bacterium]|nr:dicarboxylate/amino acid:cation symporter [Holosporaceae bacterium]
MFKKMPVILIMTTVVAVLLNPIIPNDLKRVIYAISLTLKSVVLFLLPLIIFGLLFKTFVKLSDQAGRIILLIFGCLCTSNFLNIFVTRYIGGLLYHMDFDFGQPIEGAHSLEPYFLLAIPNLIKNDFALFGGIASGIVFARINRTFALNISEKIDIAVKKLFSVVSFLIPLFIIGFVIKCISEGTLTSIVKNYSQILLIYLSYGTLYILLLYFLLNRCSLKAMLSSLSNMTPALLTALSTMSSAMSMPVTILSVEKNVKNKELGSGVISTTANIHTLGDCLCIPLIAYALLKSNGFPEPSAYSYFVFTIFFVITKFSAVAIPAGEIIIMTPILEKYLEFTPEMSTLIIAIYVIFDPFVTGFNVLGNGALAQLIDRLNCRRRSNMNEKVLDHNK